jgi:exonuclease SbcC
VRTAERELTRAQTQREQVDLRTAELARVLDGAPEPTVLRTELAAADALRRDLAAASAGVRAAREALRRAAAQRQEAQERLRAGWRGFDAARDAVASLAPPPAEREDLTVAWGALVGWAGEQSKAVRAEQAHIHAEAQRALADLNRLVSELAGLFEQAGLPRPAGGAAQREALREVAQATAARDMVAAQRAQVESLQAQRAAIEADKQVAAALTNHLRANNFEAWLLEEALDALVEGASRILRELSSGQYDLIHDDREFFVVDHHDAGLRRAVRTLSGGETFQASLALALALADQLGGMSPTASLESIMLDEGFGTLDASTLDSVAATLENLAATGDRMVGVVTHVQALAERIPVRFEITKDARTARVERVG